MRYIVITDLDGTLLDHQTYEFTPALKAIAQLEKREVPIILNSSKTKAEILAIRSELNNHELFVCENGGILCGIDTQLDMVEESGEFSTQYLGTPRHEFLPSLRSLKEKLGLDYQGFADASLDRVVRWTGLTPIAAAQAMQREATEPLYWQDTESALARFREELKELNLQCVQGGRFHHVMGNFNKASCFPELKRHYGEVWQEEVKVIALGDSPNDLPMLEQADYAVVIPSSKSNKLQLDRDTIFWATQPAPHGWQEGINFCLKNIF